MASVGELFKFLGSNDIFLNLCKDSEKTNQEVIEYVFQNEDLINKLKNIVQDENIIKSKMDILIGQKRKNQNKKQEQTLKQEDQLEEVKEFKYPPINPSKAVYLGDFAYVEQVDHRMRLVTVDFEMYY
jgi:hypothetical protein